MESKAALTTQSARFSASERTSSLVRASTIRLLWVSTRLIWASAEEYPLLSGLETLAIDVVAESPKRVKHLKRKRFSLARESSVILSLFIFHLPALYDSRVIINT